MQIDKNLYNNIDIINFSFSFHFCFEKNEILAENINDIFKKENNKNNDNHQYILLCILDYERVSELLNMNQNNFILEKDGYKVMEIKKNHDCEHNEILIYNSFYNNENEFYKEKLISHNQLMYFMKKIAILLYTIIFILINLQINFRIIIYFVR